MLTAHAEAAREKRIRKSSHGVGMWYTSYMGITRHDIAPGMTLPEPGSLVPGAFLVEQDPNTEIKAHFHIAAQFQIFVGGYGTIGTHEARNLSLYFTAAYSPYGPLRAGPEGLSFFTFRDGIDFGARYMPKERAELHAAVSRKPRFAYGGPVRPLKTDVVTPADRATIEVLPEEMDGLGAWLRRAPAGEVVTGPDPARGGAQFWLVLGGDGSPDQSRVLTRLSCLYVSSSEPPMTMIAGSHGMEALIVQFPRRDDQRPVLSH